MLKRISKVDNVKVTLLSFSSQLQIGDSCDIDAYSDTIAVQREQEFFIGSEGNLKQYKVFSEPIPLPPIYEQLYINKQNTSNIHVNRIKIIGITASSLLHIGSTERAYLENRRKHIRQLESSSPRK